MKTHAVRPEKTTSFFLHDTFPFSGMIYPVGFDCSTLVFSVFSHENRSNVVLGIAHHPSQERRAAIQKWSCQTHGAVAMPHCAPPLLKKRRMSARDVEMNPGVYRSTPRSMESIVHQCAEPKPQARCRLLMASKLAMSLLHVPEKQF